jgi:hypothetical protein
MQFFTSPEDLSGWVKIQESPSVASQKIMEITGKGEEQDIVDTCKAIFEQPESHHASEILYNVLAKHNLTQKREGSMTNKLVKEAQIIGKDAPLYANMGFKVCPKLPFSVGKRMISEYNCRNQCLDSLVFDDDPNRVYCAEAMWRRHVMDKFAREFQDKDGKLVGGYLNERFQIFRDDGGNNMELPNGERTRKPRPHQYSTERRLEEARGEKTIDLIASSSKFVKLASVDNKEIENDNYNMFNDIVEMKEAGISDEDIIYKVAEHYSASILQVASIHKTAKKLLERHDGVIYACNNPKMQKVASVNLPVNSTLVTKKQMDIKVIKDGRETVLKMETPVVVVTNGDNPTFHIAGGNDAGVDFTLKNINDAVDGFQILDEGEDKIQEAAVENGLNETPTTTTQPAKNTQVIQNPIENKEEFPITEM